MNIVLISDTHNNHRNMKLPEGDWLIHAGDWSNIGRPVVITSFIEWLESLDYKHIIVIAGNHDISMCPERTPSQDLRHYLKAEWRKTSEKIHYLEHESLEIGRWKIFGSPYTPEFAGWGFMGDKKFMKKKWAQIPEDTQILITHGPPTEAGKQSLNLKGDECGCPALQEKIKDLQDLRLHVFGHIHEGFCWRKPGGKYWSVNASHVTRDMRPIQEPIVITKEALRTLP